MTSSVRENGEYSQQKATICFQLPQSEWDIIDSYCKRLGLTKTEILRSYIRSLESKVKKAENGGNFGDGVSPSRPRFSKKK